MTDKLKTLRSVIRRDIDELQEQLIELKRKSMR